MAAIGSIRKHGVFLTIVIGVTLLLFIIGDMSGWFNFGQNTVMQVGNHKIDIDGKGNNPYSEYYEQNYEWLKIQYLNTPRFKDNSAALAQEVHEYTYQQIQREAILDEQLKKMGLSFTTEMKEEISENLLKSAGNPNSPMGTIINYALEELTGDQQDYNYIANVYNVVQQALQSPEAMETHLKGSNLYKAYKALERTQIIAAKENTYFGMATSSIHFSKKMTAQMANDNKVFHGQYAAIDFNHPAFDNIKIEVSESEAKDYFKKHKNRYITRQTEKDVEIAYFPVSPTIEDRNASMKLADSLYTELQKSASIHEFTSQSFKIENTELKYSQNSRDPYTYNILGSSVIAPFAQVDTNLYLKNDETSLQKRNELALAYKMEAYAPYNTEMTPEWKSLVSTNQSDSAFIAPKLYNNVIYFGKVRDIQMRPDSIKIARVVLRYTDEKSKEGKTSKKKNEKEMTEAEAYNKALEIKANVDGQDSSALKPYIKEFQKDSIVRPFFLVDGSSSDIRGRHIYVTNDTMNVNFYNELIPANPNECHIRKWEDANCYTVDLVMYKSEFTPKSQYVLYPVPILASSTTNRTVLQKAHKVADCQNVEEIAKATKKNGGLHLSATIRGMQYTITTNEGELDCREAINWAFSNTKKGNNTVGSVSQNPFVGTLTTYNQMTGEPTVTEVLIVMGIKASIEVQDPSFKEMKERVISDMKKEKKREAVEAKLKKEFNGKNMAEIASKYSSPQKQLQVAFSEMRFSYDNSPVMESAAVGKIANLSAGKTAVVSGENAIYLVEVSSVEKPADAKKQVIDYFSKQMDEAAAQKEAENYFNIKFTNAAYNTVLAAIPYGQYANNYPLTEVVKGLMYNDIAGDGKLIDNRIRIYGASDSNR